MILAAAPGVLHAAFDLDATVTAADGAGRRTITGTAVPWDVPGVVSSGDVVIFHAGSLDPTARPPVLLDHDPTRPIGRVAAATAHPDRLDATVRVSAVPAGDDALVLAADGARAMFSVGARPTEFYRDPDGVLHVTAADWAELSLLPVGAYQTATVATVTAQPPTNPGGTMPPDLLDAAATDDPTVPVDPPDDDDGDDGDDGDDDAGNGTATATPAVTPGVVPVTAGRGRRPAPARRHPFAHVGIDQLAALMWDGRIDAAARRQSHQVLASAALAGTIQAALADVTMVGTDNVGALYRPGYQAELVDIVSHGSPAVDAISQGDLQRGDFPNKTFNVWTKTPQVALQSAEKAEINSTPVSVGPSSTPVRTWATGNDISQQTLDFGSPDFVADYVRAAGVDYAEVIDVYAITTMLAAATAVTTAAGATLPEVIAALIGGLDPTKVPAGQLFALVSWDIGVGAMGVTYTDKPAFWDGSINFGSFIPTQNMGGLTVTVDPNMPAATALLGLRNAATWYDLPGTPFTLRAINVGALGLDIAVYGYGALGVKYPGALTKTTVPPVTP